MHKQARFLPPVEDEKFALNPGSGFSTYERKFLENISSNMVGSKATAAEPRAPSPFGRVWQFRRSLAGELGEKRKAEAVSAFRGILALIALREHYHLPVELGVSPMISEGDSKLAKLFAPHAACVPESMSNQCAPFLWNGRLMYFYLKLGNQEFPFAGYSPLTLVYPAAKKLPSGLAQQIFWYDEPTGKLIDPTTLPPTHTASSKSRAIRPWIKKWLEHISSDQVMASLNMASGDLVLVCDHILKSWLVELDKESSVQNLATHQLRFSAEMDALADKPLWPALFEKVVPTAGLTDVPVKPRRSDNRETLIISLNHVALSSTQVYGTIHGSAQIKDILRVAPPAGDDLGAILGISAPMPYVILDHLFEDTLPVIFQSTGRMAAISSNWKALTLNNEAYLYPLKSTLLEYFGPKEIAANTTVENSVTGFSVTFGYGAAKSHRNYPSNARPLMDSSMDLRLFPNFALDTLPKVEELLNRPTDRCYHARLRLFPMFTLGKTCWLNEDGKLIPDSQSQEGSFEAQNGISPGKQLFWEIKDAHLSKNRPAIFLIEGSGMLFVDLPSSGVAELQDCQIGLDFGTSNTCLYYRLQNDSKPKPLLLPILTTSLLPTWDIDLGRGADALGYAAEGFAAIFDFPYQNNNFPKNPEAGSLGLAVHVLNPKTFFPTQIVHQKVRAIPKELKEFSPKHGLAFFQNITVTSLSEGKVSDLIDGFDELKARNDSRRPPKRFKLERDLKWEDDVNKGQDNNKAKRHIFHAHLRLHVILAVAKEGGHVTKLQASYPKAFKWPQPENYREHLDFIWKVPSLVTMSESAAAAADLEVGHAELIHLIDIGGGTSDFAIYHNKELEGEASFRMAGSFLEEYFRISQPFREFIAGVCLPQPEFTRFLNQDRLDDFKASLKANGSDNELLLKNAFQGIISIMSPQKIIRYTLEGNSKACAGFLLTNLVFYSGLAYAAGLIHGTLGRNQNQYQLGVRWVGNGSCFLSAMNVGGEAHGFQNALAEIFKKAAGLGGEVSCLPLPDAKTIVARGLLKPQVTRMDKAQNVAAKTFSNSLSNTKDSLVEFYAQDSLEQCQWDGLIDGPFKSYLESLQSAIPNLRMGVANLGGNVLGFTNVENWAVEYVTKRKGSIAEKFQKRMLNNYGEWHQIAKTDAGNLQVEPLFITEVCALLEDIREHCGNAA